VTDRNPRQGARRRRGLVVALSAVAIVLVLAMTLTPDPPWLFRVLADLLDPWVPAGSVARLLNVLLFVPLGLAIGLWRRPWWLLGAAAGSVAIELTQHLLDERSPDVLDVVTNTLGAALGYLAGRWWRARSGSATGGPAEEGSTAGAGPRHRP
jgi:glycopeptide antibiotics resistance protein